MFVREVNGAKEYGNGWIVIGDKQIFNPTDEQYIEAGYTQEEDITE